MFTGIVQAVGQLTALMPTGEGLQLRVATPENFTRDVTLGASVAVDGICLTVVEFGERELVFDAIHHTLRTTNLGDRQLGDPVNLERSFRFGEEVGGHVVSGHVSSVAEITSLQLDGGDNHLAFRVDPAWAPYVFARGFLAVDGASLTVAEYDGETRIAKIFVIPETIRATAFSGYRVGEKVNIEVESQTRILVDVISATIKNSLRQG